MTEHHAIKACWGVELQLHAFLTSALDGGCLRRKNSIWKSNTTSTGFISLGYVISELKNRISKWSYVTI